MVSIIVSKASIASSVEVTQIGSGVIIEDTGVREGSSDWPTTFLLSGGGEDRWGGRGWTPEFQLKRQLDNFGWR